MGVLGWIVFGLVVGAVAKFVMPGRDPGGIIVTMLLGIAGAVLGGTFVATCLVLSLVGGILAMIGVKNQAPAPAWNPAPRLR